MKKAKVPIRNISKEAVAGDLKNQETVVLRLGNGGYVATNNVSGTVETANYLRSNRKKYL